MSNSDKRIATVVFASILIHLVTLTLNLAITVFALLTTLLNLVVGASILTYWTQKQIRITQHYLELREIFVLGFEVIVISCAVCSILMQNIQWLHVAHIVILVIHLIFLLLFFVFMLTFKMKKLF